MPMEREIIFGTVDLGIDNQQTATHAYVTIEGMGSHVLRVMVDQSYAWYEYPFEAGEGISHRIIKLGRGIKGRVFTFGVRFGCEEFELYKIDLEMAEYKRSRKVR